MSAPELTLFVMLCFLFLIVGGILGWLAMQQSYTRQIYTHPEMFDENGNIIPDEILAVRFENYDDNHEDEEED